MTLRRNLMTGVRRSKRTTRQERTMIEVCSHGNALNDISFCVQCNEEAEFIYEAQGGQ